MTAPSRINVQKDLIYADDARPLLWDVYSPSTHSAGRPVALLLHGGGLRMGGRDHMTAAATELAERGYVAIAPEYRLLGEAPWPQQLNDVRTAIRAVRAQAEILGASSDHVFAVGFSAGGYLALMAASAPASSFRVAHRPHAERSETLAGVAAFFPITKADLSFVENLGVGPDLVDAVSPMTFAAQLPPTILFSGDADPLTPHANLLEYYHAIQTNGGEADLRLYARLIHEFVALPGMLSLTLQDAAAFFERTAINKIAFDESLKNLEKFWTDILAQTKR